MGRAAACKFLGQIHIVDGMGIDGIKADQITLWASHDKGAEIIGFRELVCGLPKEVVDLFNAARKAVPVMFCNIERLNDIAPRAG